MPPDRAPRIPPEDELLEIAVETLGLSQSAASVFTTSVRQLAATLDQFHREGITPNDARRRVLKSLKKARKSLHAAFSILDQERALFDLIATDGVTEDLSKILSLAGIRRPDSSEPYLYFDEQEISLAVHRSRDGGAEWIMSEMQKKVRRIVADHPAQSLLDLLKLLRDAVDAEIEIQSFHNRGRPKNHVRDYIIEYLLALHGHLFNTPATTTPGGSFSIMCEAVLESLGQCDAGLASAISRIVRREKDARGPKYRTGY